MAPEPLWASPTPLTAQGPSETHDPNRSSSFGFPLNQPQKGYPPKKTYPPLRNMRLNNPCSGYSFCCNGVRELLTWNSPEGPFPGKSQIQAPPTFGASRMRPTSSWVAPVWSAHSWASNGNGEKPPALWATWPVTDVAPPNHKPGGLQAQGPFQCCNQAPSTNPTIQRFRKESREGYFEGSPRTCCFWFQSGKFNSKMDSFLLGHGVRS